MFLLDTNVISELRKLGDGKADARAVETLGRLFPGREVVALEVDRIYENGGGIHCVTQQEPA